MKKSLSFCLFILFITQVNAQLIVGDSFNDGSISYKVESLSPSEASVIGFSGATVADLVIPSSASSGTQTFDVVGVGPNAFQSSGVVTVEFPSTLRFIEDFAFQGNGSTLSSFNITNPSALNSLGRSIFAGCFSLESADLSDISADLSESSAMFNNCQSLTTFIMKNNTAVTTIPSAFLGTCSAMTTADFSGSSNITAFFDNVFRNNTSLTTLYLGTDIPPSVSSNSGTETFAYVNNAGLSSVDRTLYVPTSSAISNYSTNNLWSNIFGNFQSQEPLVVGDVFNDEALSYKVESIDPAEVSVTGFSGSTVADLVIPSSASASNSEENFTVVGIAENAFKQKPGLVSVEFPITLRYIEDTAFQQTESLRSFNITNPNALTTLGRAIFEGCISLESADLSSISADLSNSDSMFNNCTSLTSFKMNDNTATTVIPPVFLGSCSAMTTADFTGSTNITTISDNVFRNNTSLTTLYMGTDTPPSVSSDLSSGTFANINNGDLTSVDRILYLPTDIGASNYSDISAWTNVFETIIMIPVLGDTFDDEILSYKIESVNPVEASVTGFSGATVADLVIPSLVSNSGQKLTVVGIAESAFKQKSGLVTVEFPTTLRYIEDTAFQQTETLESFNITNPYGLISLGLAIFEECIGLVSADLSGSSADVSNSDSMFNNCTSLSSFKMNDNTATTTIPPTFLGSCLSMTTADFSGCINIATISDNAFSNNISLTELYLGTNVPPSVSIDPSSGTFVNINDGGLTKADRTLQVPTITSVSNYSAISTWTEIFETIQNIPGPEQLTARPLIWVKESEKDSILNEISNNEWKNNYFTNFKNRVDEELADYMADRQGYLNQLPFNITNVVDRQIPPFKTISNSQPNAAADRNTYKLYLQSGVDSGVLYYLTGNEDYAKYSASLFYTYMKAMNQVPLSDASSINAGWIYRVDHLREARDFGAQLPILYDFISEYNKNGGTAYDFAADQEVTINWLDAEKVFKNYIMLAKERGGIATNWPALESPSLMGNILALDSDEERNTELQYVINMSTNRQIPLSVMSQKIANNDGIWPEPFSYAKFVAEYSTYIMTVLTKYNASYDLVSNYSNIPFSLPIPNDFHYPNGNRTLHFGDGSRGFQKYRDGYEIAYYLGKLTNNNTFMDKFGDLIVSSIDYDNYNREGFSSQRTTVVEPYFKQPLRLLWYSGNVNGESSDFEQNVTSELSFAGISVQRNLETPDPVINGLMLFVGGAGYVHSYASGMNMELYGPKTVIGAAAGNTGNYTSTIHRNYYRLFAAHNTVIVNGASQGGGGIADIHINRVQKLSIEPEYNEIPVSPNNSFSTTRFYDYAGSLAQALQYRTMAIVRTSPTTGYYVDVFKSDSSLDNEYHDYVYHNLSDNLELEGSGSNLTLTSDPNRYASGNPANGYNNPGWQYFDDIETSGVYTDDITATFTATNLGGSSVNMKMFIPGETNREYTRVNAPPTLGITGSYQNTPTPTVVIRKDGEAWDKPFAVVYEPYYGDNTNSVTQVTNITRDGTFKGMEVLSTVDGNTIKQIILVTDNDDGVFNDATLDVEFTGRFIVLSLDEDDELSSIYMGKGSYIKYKGWDISSADGNATSFYVEIVNNHASITTNSELIYTHPSSITIIDDDTLSIPDYNFNDLDKTLITYQNQISKIWNFEIKNIEITRNTNLTIVNLLGQTVYTKKINSTITEANLETLSDGLHIALVTDNNSVVASKKFVITN